MSTAFDPGFPQKGALSGQLRHAGIGANKHGKKMLFQATVLRFDFDASPPSHFATG